MSTTKVGSAAAGVPDKAVKTIFAFALIGIVFSGLLVYHYTEILYGASDKPSACVINEMIDCDAVARSAYSTVFGVPVAVYSLWYYLLLAIVTLKLGRHQSVESGNLLLFFTLLSVPPSLIYLAISTFVIKLLCVYCMLLYVNSFALAFFAVRNLPQSDSAGNALLKGSRVFLERSTGFGAIKSILPAAALFALLAMVPNFLLQSVFAPQRAEAERNLQAEMVLARYRQSSALPIPIEESGQQQDYSLGPVNAPIVIVEWSDYECPHCKLASKAFHELLKSYPTQIRVVFKDYPLDSSCNKYMQNRMHLRACQAAFLARCAGVRGPEWFWKMNEELFALGEFSEPTLRSAWTKLKFTAEEFDACSTTPEVTEKIQRSIEEGQNLKITGTPAVFVNGRRVKNPSKEELEALIKALLADRIKKN